ncbi:MAG: 50S ribosomal protein L15 [Patescibacteria group bacterium]|nr:50S ribosomal protein L15 [Patescibacteria group bacterium]
MKYNELKTVKPKAAKRVGRGIAAGKGKTAGRGTKGQKSRTGSSAKPGFAGGQNPLMQKLPKLPGFKSKRTPAENVTTSQIDALGKKTVDALELANAGLTSGPFVNVKLLFKGDMTSAVTVKLAGASKTAISALEAKGGSFEKTARAQRPASTRKTVDEK